MNRFLTIVNKLLIYHGQNLTYTKVVTGAYDVETGSPSITKTNYSKKLYPKHFIANNYNYPALIGKETCMFYLANDSLGFTPGLNDEITYNSKTYAVQSYQEHVANGEIVLYRIIAAKI